MWHKEHWTKYANGNYGYINGVSVQRESEKPPKWVVYTTHNDKKNILYVSNTLAACKYWLAHSYDTEEEHNGHFHFK